MGELIIDYQTPLFLSIAGASAVFIAVLAIKGVFSKKFIFGMFSSLYLCAVLSLTLFPISLPPEAPDGPVSVNWDLSRMLEFYTIHDALKYMAVSLLLLAPLAVLCAAAEFRFVNSIGKVLLGTAGLSVVIESIQQMETLAGLCSRPADLNDVILNTFGAVIAYLVMQSLLQCRGSAKDRIILGLKWLFGFMAVGEAGVVIICFLMISPLGTGADSLSDRQKDSLCDAMCTESVLEEVIPGKVSIAYANVLGVRDVQDAICIYGYVSQADYVPYKGRAYKVAETSRPFMADAVREGDGLVISKEYGDGTSAESILMELPFRYRLKLSKYTTYDDSGYKRMLRERDSRAEMKMGIPVEKAYVMSLNLDEGTFAVTRVGEDGQVELKHQGLISELNN